jgi:hypothetical protein
MKVTKSLVRAKLFIPPMCSLRSGTTPTPHPRAGGDSSSQHSAPIGQVGDQLSSDSVESQAAIWIPQYLGNLRYCLPLWSSQSPAQGRESLPRGSEAGSQGTSNNAQDWLSASGPGGTEPPGVKYHFSSNLQWGDAGNGALFGWRNHV